jgi:hypothetical protein
VISTPAIILSKVAIVIAMSGRRLQASATYKAFRPSFTSIMDTGFIVVFSIPT